jgi:hypothetical protein
VDTHDLLEDQDIKELVLYRNIQPEDYFILQNLAKFPKTVLFTNFHNFFTSLKGHSAEALVQIIAEIERQLESDIHNAQLRELKEIHEWYLEICRKYDWATADNINKVLERLQN